MDFSLRVNRKQIATNSSPYRDQQFQHIGSLRTRFQRQGLPIISVDSKKRELIGNFKNAGAKWDRSPVLVNDHDFRIRCQRSGHLLRHLRPAAQPRHRLRRHLARYPGLRRPFHRHLVETRRIASLGPCSPVADSWRTPAAATVVSSWAWKTEIQAQVCNAFGFTATIAHYPTGASKWNPIEHRVFSEISKNWAAEPLDSYEKMLNFIRTTSTQTGLAVTAYLDRKEYPTGLKPDRSLISSLRLKHNTKLPRWNYTIAPNL